MRIWELEIQDENSTEVLEGFLSKKQVDEYISQHKKTNDCLYTMREYEGKKLDATLKQFFDFFQIPSQDITLEQREQLESIFENDYTIMYEHDQWSACILCTSVKINNEYFYKEIARGEGNSNTEALCSLLILKSDLIPEELKEWMRDEVFKKKGDL